MLRALLFKQRCDAGAQGGGRRQKNGVHVSFLNKTQMVSFCVYSLCCVFHSHGQNPAVALTRNCKFSLIQSLIWGNCHHYTSNSAAVSGIPMLLNGTGLYKVVTRDTQRATSKFYYLQTPHLFIYASIFYSSTSP